MRTTVVSCNSICQWDCVLGLVDDGLCSVSLKRRLLGGVILVMLVIMQVYSSFEELLQISGAVYPPAAGVIYSVSPPAAGVIYSVSLPAADVICRVSPRAAGVIYSATSPTAGNIYSVSPPAAGVIYSATRSEAGVIYSVSLPAAGVIYSATRPAAGVIYSVSPPAVGVIYRATRPAAGVIYSVSSVFWRNVTSNSMAVCILVPSSRSPRWTSGSPRMLLVLVREFESRRGEILTLFAKERKKKDQLLRAPGVGKHNSTRVDEGRKSSNLPAIKMNGTNRSG